MVETNNNNETNEIQHYPLQINKNKLQTLLVLPRAIVITVSGYNLKWLHPALILKKGIKFKVLAEELV